MRWIIPFGFVATVLGLQSVRPTGPAPNALPSPPHNVLVNDRATDIAPYIAQKEPTLAVFGTHIVVGWNDERYRLSQTKGGINSSVGYAFSTDGGSTFTDAGELGASHWGADPSVAVDRAGNFYFGRIDLTPDVPLSRPGRIGVYKSTDGGATFPGSTSPSTGLFGIQDKPLITVDNTGGPFDASVYAIWNNFNNNVPTSVFSRSTDGGASFSTPFPLSTSKLNVASWIAVGPGGELYVVGANGSQIYVQKSLDGGASFAPPVSVASVNPVIGVQSSCDYCGGVLKGDLPPSSPPIIAVDRSGGSTHGKVYVVFGSAPELAGNDMTDVYLTSSSDGGNTWSAPVRLNDDATPNDQWKPFVAVAPTGEVAAMWYDRRSDPANLLFDVFMTISVDGGASFGPNFRITEVSSPPPGINYKLGFPPCTCVGAEYNFMVADATSFYLVWTDNRLVNSGLVDPNIFFARVPIGSLPPSPRRGPVELPTRRIRQPGVVKRTGP